MNGDSQSVKVTQSIVAAMSGGEWPRDYEAINGKIGRLTPM